MIKFKIDGEQYYISDVMTIENYVKIYKVKDLFDEDYFPAKIVSLVSGASADDLKQGGYKEVAYLAQQVIRMLPNENNLPFVERFMIDDVHYGFFPTWKELTFAEFMDMDTLLSKPQDEILNYLHVLAAIMYRPIVEERSKHDFDIEPYDVETMKTRAELFNKRLNVSVILAASVFFCKLEKNYSLFSPQYLTKMNLSLWQTIKMIWKMWRLIYKIRSNKPTDGIWYSTEFVKTILQDTNTSIKKIS
jgi:hypothetical protein